MFGSWNLVTRCLIVMFINHYMHVTNAVVCFLVEPQIKWTWCVKVKFLNT
uniref:Uncharacterized protein n=1 Tax=Rhizophora mucronata TaxID=61149 RepID=A0A2P2Q6F0_RHIMU